MHSVDNCILKSYFVHTERVFFVENLRWPVLEADSQGDNSVCTETFLYSFKFCIFNIFWIIRYFFQKLRISVEKLDFTNRELNLRSKYGALKFDDFSF